MKCAIVGYTGFVGSTLLRQHPAQHAYNSRNIGEIVGQDFDLLLCAGAPAEKWKANAEPQADRANLQRLMSALSACHASRAVLISTVDVYATPCGVDEGTAVIARQLQPYGRHRWELEQFFAAHFPTSHVVRLPGLFGEGLRKNLLFDLLRDGTSAWTDHRSVFQFYDMSRVWSDLQAVLAAGLPLVNFAVEPVEAGEVARHCFAIDFRNQTENGPVRYDMHSQFSEQLGGRGHYLYNAAESLERIRAFVVAERRRRGSP